jgi:hypothetical protein
MTVSGLGRLLAAAAAFSMTAVPSGYAGDAANHDGMWVSPEALRGFPRAAWDRLKAVADGKLERPDIADLNSGHDVETLAVALVYARLGNPTYRAKAAQGILAAVGTEAGGTTLALGRNLVSYVIAADLVNLAES